MLIYKQPGYKEWKEKTDSEKIDALAMLYGWTTLVLLALIIYIGTR